MTLPVHIPRSSLPAMRRYHIAGLTTCGLLIGGVGSWAAVTDLAGAVISPANVVVESELKRVQHPSGGVVGVMNVKNGDFVKAGDVVLRLDETVTRARLETETKLLDELVGRFARLEAERDGADAITFPDEFIGRVAHEPAVAKILNGEQTLFEARRAAHAGQQAQITERITQLNQEIEGLVAQKSSTAEQIILIDDELEVVNDLYKKNLVSLTRLNALRREASRLKGEHGRLVAMIAESKGKIAETELQIIQMGQDLRTEVLGEMREVQSRISESMERKIAAEDELKRIAVRSPQDGIIHQLTVHTVGQVIGVGETLMLVVPRDDTLVIESKVSPQDIDQVAVGRPAVVRLLAFNRRTTPELAGTVTRVSADLTTDQVTGLSYYTVRVALAPRENARVGALKVVPGMPAEVHIQTEERTALSYFIKPLTDQMARAFKEE